MTSSDRPVIGRFRAPRPPSFVDTEVRGGLHVIAVRRPGIPLVQVRLAVPLPAEQIRRSAPALVMAKSMLAGTEDHDRQGLAEAVDRLGGSLNATVAEDLLILDASALAERLPDLLELLAEVLCRATYPAPEVKADRGRQADEVTIALSRPEVLADEAFAGRLFGRHPYGTEMPRPGALLRVGAAGLRALHSGVLTPRGAHLVLVGDLQPKRAVTLVERCLAPWVGSRSRGRAGATGASAVLPPLPSIEPGPVELVDRQGAVQSNLRIGGRAPDRSQPDWPATALANAIAGGMFTSRLVENLRERNGYTYSPRSGVSHRRAGSTFEFSAEVSTGVTAAALVETRYELGRIATSGVTDEEVVAAGRYVIGRWLFQTATQAGLASVLARLAVVGVGPEYLSQYPAQIARTKRREVEAAARRYLAPAGLVTVVLGDAGAVGESLAVVGEVRGRIVSTGSRRGRPTSGGRLSKSARDGARSSAEPRYMVLAPASIRLS